MLEGELVKPPQIDKKAWEKFALLIGSLPLEKCTREHNPLTNEWGWKAPEGEIFRISGHFVTKFDQSGIDKTAGHYGHQSADMLKEEYATLFREFLEEAEGNEAEALRLLVEDIHDGLSSGMTPAQSFHGEWLVASPDLKQDFDKDKESKVDKPEIMIKKNVGAWLSRGSLKLIEDITPQSSIVTGVLFDSQSLVVHWQQKYAEAVLGKCKIEFVDDCLEEEKKLYVPETKDDKHLFLPEGTRKRGIYSNCEFQVKTNMRQDVNKEKLENFANNSGLIFIDREPNSDLLIARRTEEIILPKEEKERTKDIPF